jgi:L-ascorbate metabolism protein UlaG (beta-lactamase superfamily)
MDLHGAQVTWIGHGTFKLQSPGGKSLLIDPWVQGNPACPAALKSGLGKLDYVLITHGHGDHIGDAITVARDSQPDQIVAVFELAAWLEGKGVQHTVGMNKGGSYDLGGIRVTMVHADHSCGIQDGDQIIYGGEAVGYVITFENGFRLYASGDTNLFGDMRLIAELYHPEVAILPIGDFYTMGPREAARAAQLLNVRAVIPGHYATFPALPGTPGALREELARLGAGAVEVAEIQPGDTIS